jgi:hypothetical protein
MDFEQLIHGTLLFDQFVLMLPLRALAHLAGVCTLFRDALNRDSLWRAIALAQFRDKVFVPAFCVRLLRLESETEYDWCVPHVKLRQQQQQPSTHDSLVSSASNSRFANSMETRWDLAALSVRDLRLLCASYKLDTRACCERQELVALVHRHETARAFPGECLMKYAFFFFFFSRFV